MAISATKAIINQGRVKDTSIPFDSADEIVTIHLYRYNREINKLRKTKEIDQKRVDGKLITWKMFYTARNNKIKAFNDLINTLIQKEELLSFHQREFFVDINETVVIKTTPASVIVENLKFEEQLELLKLMKKMKDENELIGIRQNSTENNKTEVDDSKQLAEKPNIEDIKHKIQPTQVINKPDYRNPTAMINETVMRVAAKRIREAGGTLDIDEQKLI